MTMLQRAAHSFTPRNKAREGATDKERPAYAVLWPGHESLSFLPFLASGAPQCIKGSNFDCLDGCSHASAHVAWLPSRIQTGAADRADQELRNEPNVNLDKIYRLSGFSSKVRRRRRKRRNE